VVPQYHTLALWSQSRCQSSAFFFTEDHAAKLVVHSLGVTVKVRHVLVNHLKLTRKGTPCLARLTVRVACSNHVGPRLVYRRVDEEPGGIGGPRRVAADYIAVIADQHHVRSLQRCKMLPERVGPKSVRVLRISHLRLTVNIEGDELNRGRTEM
jgi:hypothetical protein